MQRKPLSPWDDDDAQPAFQAQPTGLLGTLKQMSMTDVMQMLDMGKKSARVDVHFGDESGVVHVHEGQIVRAVVGKAQGEAAFTVLARQRDGFFRIHFEKEPVEPNVHRPTTFVLLEAMRIIDEERQNGAPAPVDEHIAEAPVQQYPRYRVSLPVELMDDNGVAVQYSLEDISLGGSFVRSDAPPPRNSLVRLRFTAVDDGFVVTGRVVHILDAKRAAQHQRAPGCGLQFEDMSIDAAMKLRRLVDGLEKEERRRSPRPPESWTSIEDATDVLNLISEADFLVATGDREQAKRVLQQALELAPHDDDIRNRIDGARAAELLDAAEATASKEDARPQVLRAVDVRPSPEILHRALTFFLRANFVEDAQVVTDRLLRLQPNDEVALQALLDLHVAASRWQDAVRAADALVRLRPNDARNRELLRQLVIRARRKPA